MPMKLNVGLSRKIGEANYGSRGASVNLEMELDSGLVLEPAKLQEKIRQLFGLVKTSLAEELNGGNHGQTAPANAPANGNGQNPQRSSQPRPATQSQVKAIYAIARQYRLRLDNILKDRFQVERPEDLTIKEASSIIDELKKSEAKRGG